MSLFSVGGMPKVKARLSQQCAASLLGCMHVCMCVCMCACMCLCVRMNVRMYVRCMYVCMYVCMHVCMYVCMHHTYACMYACSYANMCTCISVSISLSMILCIYACMPWCIHTHAGTYYLHIITYIFILTRNHVHLVDGIFTCSSSCMCVSICCTRASALSCSTCVPASGRIKPSSAALSRSP